MKRVLVVLGFIVVGCSCFGQKATMINDTLYYNAMRVAVGDTVNFGYGSAPNKDFIFVYTGGVMGSGNEPMPATMSKISAIVTKVYKQSGKLLFRAKAIDTNMKLFVQLDAAIDNKELVF